MIFIGNLSGRLLTTGVLYLRKCTILPGSEKSHCTDRFSFVVLILVANIGISHIFLALTINFPAVFLVGMVSGAALKNSATLVISGAHLPTYFSLSSFVVIVP